MAKKVVEKCAKVKVHCCSLRLFCALWTFSNETLSYIVATKLQLKMLL